MVEDSGIERRRYPRVSLQGDEHRVSFHLQGRAVEDARLVNLSAGGCGLEVQISQAGGLEAGTTLEAFYLDHPELPHLPLPATVVRVLGKVPGKTTGYILVGVEFTMLTPLVQGLIASHVETRLG
mgnify:FL=1